MGQRNVEWQNRAHFFAIAAQLMRRILVDNARRERRPKAWRRPARNRQWTTWSRRPRSRRWTPWTRWRSTSPSTNWPLIDPDQARIVELRFFGGMTIEETAEVMNVSPATIKREWALAKGWLYRELTGDSSHP